MRVMLIGGGGREHALAAALRRSARVSHLMATPGNAGIAQLAEILNVGADATQIADEAVHQRADLIVVGPENALDAGVVDEATRRGIPAFGPTAAAARLESSKAWTSALMSEFDIPAPAAASFTDLDAAIAYIRGAGAPIVIKADGLAFGKGVKVCRTLPEAEAFVHATMRDGAFGAAGAKVVVEEFIDGWEFSLMFFTDGQTYRLMPHSQDHKPVGDGDKGDNTGGMGAYTNVASITNELIDDCKQRIIEPLLAGLAQRGIQYKGVITGNLIVDERGPKVMEFNARFGDPECPLVLPLLSSDIVDAFEAVIGGKLDQVEPRWDNRAALCVTMAAAGYPGKPRTGDPISGLGDEVDDVHVFHAGTKLSDGLVVTNGGRVLTVTGIGDDVAAARDRAYQRVATLGFAGEHHRSDIGWRTLGKPAE